MNKKNILKLGASLLAVLSCSFNASATFPSPQASLFGESDNWAETQCSDNFHYTYKLVEELNSRATVYGYPQHNSASPGHGTESLSSALEITRNFALNQEKKNVHVYFNMTLKYIFGCESLGCRRPDVTITYMIGAKRYAILIEVKSETQTFESQEEKCNNMIKTIESLGYECEKKVHYLAKNSLSPEIKKVFSGIQPRQKLISALA